MIERQSEKTFFDILRNNALEDIKGPVELPSLALYKENWYNTAEAIGDVAAALYGDDITARREFIAKVIGLPPEGDEFHEPPLF